MNQECNPIISPPPKLISDRNSKVVLIKLIDNSDLVGIFENETDTELSLFFPCQIEYDDEEASLYFQIWSWASNYNVPFKFYKNQLISISELRNEICQIYFDYQTSFFKNMINQSEDETTNKEKIDKQPNENSTNRFH